jgi:hypothetical protein
LERTPLSKLRAQAFVSLLMLVATSYFLVANISQYYFVSDDAYISFIYARNLVFGDGLVWSSGDVVEGYTNFLWVILMAASIYAGVGPDVSANVLGIAAAIILLLSIAYVFAREHGWLNPFTWLPLLVLALSRSFTAWATSGLEVMVFSLLLFLACIQYIRERESGTSLPIWSALLFALAILKRPDGAVFVIVAGLFFLGDIVAGRRSLRTGFIWAAPIVAIVGVHLAWRYSFYGYWLPNTFYAKVAGAWLQQGINYIALFFKSYYLYPFLPFVLIAVWQRRDFTNTFFLGLLAGFAAYILYVGGDVFEFRFMVAVMPYFYLLIVDGMAISFAAFSRSQHLALATRAVVLAAVAGLLFATVHGSENPIPRKFRHGFTTLAGMKTYAESRAEQGRFIRRMIDEGRLPDGFVIGVGGAGAVPYFTELPTIDRRGLNDVAIARQPIESRGRIAHEKDASYDYLQERGVAVFDLFNQLVFEDRSLLDDPEKHYFDGRKVAVRGIKLDGRYLIFATFVPLEKLQEIFAGISLLEPSRSAARSQR